jgi:hypothetical protein
MQTIRVQGSFGDAMALMVRGHVIPSSNRSAKQSNPGCEVKGSDGVGGIRVSGVSNRTSHDTRQPMCLLSLTSV